MKSSAFKIARGGRNIHNHFWMNNEVNYHHCCLNLVVRNYPKNCRLMGYTLCEYRNSSTLTNMNTSVEKKVESESINQQTMRSLSDPFDALNLGGVTDGSRGGRGVIEHHLLQMVKQDRLKYDKGQHLASKRLSKLYTILVNYYFEKQASEKGENDKVSANEKNERNIRNSNTQVDRTEQQPTGAGMNKQDNNPQTTNLTQPNSTSTDKEPTPRKTIPRGAYIHGDVGTGKSMLLDIMFDHLQRLHVEQQQPSMTITERSKGDIDSGVSPLLARRLHYHAFMTELHNRIHKLKTKDLANQERSFHVNLDPNANPVVRIAHEIADETCFLCLDEFQILDIADAYILSQLFRILFARGVILITTSNRKPLELYENGLNRSYILQFLNELERHCMVMDIKSEVDYRYLMSKEQSENYFIAEQNDDTLSSFDGQVDDGAISKSPSQSLKTVSKTQNSYFFVGKNDTNANACCELFHAFATDNASDKTTKSSILTNHKIPSMYKRSITIPLSASNNSICRFSFHELCGSSSNYAASDYRALASSYQIVMVENLPRFNTFVTGKENNPDEARRFITLMDELYEQKCCLVCTSNQPLSELFGEQATNNKIDTTNNLEDIDGTTRGIDVAQNSQGGRTMGELASVLELSFAFKRAGSRIVEMCSAAWWKEHLTDAGAQSVFSKTRA
mmetsp:Transcript_63436/g.76269  ORF Transcript_63436/g.76269 Transcript_63436/m.76269 type:complete len:678 (-) Transcript_63436:103-2136(-)